MRWRMGLTSVEEPRGRRIESSPPDRIRMTAVLRHTGPFAVDMRHMPTEGHE